MPRQIFFIIATLAFAGGLLVVGSAAASAPPFAPTPQPTPIVGHVATAAELLKAQGEWQKTRHANTFDDGAGANTTCASCKSPRNWDPNALAQSQALDCNACKRVAGEPRPPLEGGVPVSQTDWKNVGCNQCHQPVGNSYSTALSYWDQSLGAYVPMQSATQLCGQCHEGLHGFEVIQEQAASSAHQGWECTKCHGSHGTPVKCTDCHDPTIGKGAAEHARHTDVNCTACHDAGNLTIWLDQNVGSKHYATYAPIRFAHALRSWTSHNLAAQVDCGRCHHPGPGDTTPVVANVECKACHPDGAVSFWCRYFPRNFPFSTATPYP